jgi:hypothetical protein
MSGRFHRWLDENVFVKSKNARLAITIFSVLAGAAANVALRVWKRKDPTCFLNRFDEVTAGLVRRIASIGLAIYGCALTALIYNLWKRKEK